MKVEILGPAGAQGILSLFLVNQDEAIIGWIAIGTHDNCRLAARRFGDVLTGVAQTASRTLQMALALAQGCLPMVARLDIIAGLTPRERQIVELVAAGLSDLNVAQRLHISDETVGSHLRNIYSRLGIHNRVDLTRLVSAA